MCVIIITTVFNVFSTCVPVSLSTIITMFVMQIMNMLMSTIIKYSSIHMYIYILIPILSFLPNIMICLFIIVIFKEK